MSPAHVEMFADAVIQRCAELLAAEMRPAYEAQARRRQEARKRASPAPAPAAPAVKAGNVVDLAAYRRRRAARRTRAA